MCGIAGIIAKDTNHITNHKLKKMTDIISHRGPDGEGHWISADRQVGLGHRRLSIIDLSHEADQPMHYLGRYTIVFNGEIYNYVELKDLLVKQGYTFKTKSDTEVLMALYDRDKENCLQLLDGMFAFVIHDNQENKVFCARDRFGEKPFFYSYEQGKYFYFGSEMKCLWAGGIIKDINNRMLYNYLSFGYIENPSDLSETFYNNCTRLAHSHYLIIDLQSLKLNETKYYDIDFQNQNKDISIDGAKEKLKELFYTSMQRRLRSDVTVGSSLSGGLDSSLVVSVIDNLMSNSNQKQKTFSAVFPGFKKDERKFMDYVIAKTNVQPHFVTPNDEQMITDLSNLNWHQEEPYGSASIYVQYRVMQLAKENNVTVLIDGQGADEILAGYHFFYNSFFKELKNLDKTQYRLQQDKYKELHQDNSINGIVNWTLGDKVRNISPALVKPMKSFKIAWNQKKNPIFNKDFYNQYKKEVFETSGTIFNTLNEALYYSTYQFGLQQLLRYADRNSMAHSREIRLPFLNHELVEFMFSLPSTFKMNDGWTKWIMRETFSILPPEIQWRKDKIGYEPPQQNWLESNQINSQILKSKQKYEQQGILHKHSISERVSTNNELKWRYLMIESLS